MWIYSTANQHQAGFGNGVEVTLAGRWDDGITCLWCTWLESVHTAHNRIYFTNGPPTTITQIVQVYCRDCIKLEANFGGLLCSQSHTQEPQCHRIDGWSLYGLWHVYIHTVHKCHEQGHCYQIQYNARIGETMHGRYLHGCHFLEVLLGMQVLEGNVGKTICSQIRTACRKVRGFES